MLQPASMVMCPSCGIQVVVLSLQQIPKLKFVLSDVFSAYPRTCLHKVWLILCSRKLSAVINMGLVV